MAHSVDQGGVQVSPVPVFVVAGFLGSGKTTLLNHLLREQHGLKLAVIVNDFGAIPVDAMLVAGQVDAMVSLANGCLCCEASPEELEEALGKLGGIPGVMGIVIEASGVADPAALLSVLVRATAKVNVTVGGVIEVVDAGEFVEAVERHPSLAHRLHGADLVVINKADRVSREHLGQVRQMVRECAPAVMVVTTAFGRLDPRVLFDASGDVLHDGSTCDHDECRHPHLHDEYSVVSVPLERPLHPGRFMDFVAAGAGVAYRVKGFISLAGADGPETMVFEKAGQHIRLRRWFPHAGAVEWGGDQFGEGDVSGLVFIGVDLVEEHIVAACGQCVWGGEEGDPVTPGQLWSFYPYLQDEADEPEDYWGEMEEGGTEFLVDPEEDPTFLP